MTVSLRQVWLAGLCALALLLGAGSLDVNAAGWQFWPEADWRFPMKWDSQLVVAASLKDNEDSDEQELQVGSTITFPVSTFKAAEAKSAEEKGRQYLRGGVGYRFITSLYAEGDAYREHRGILELTPRFYLPYGIVVSDRNRVDLRWIDGEDFSTRYRNRVTVEREFRLQRRAFSIYVSAEMFNDSRFEGWDRRRLDVGVRLPLAGLLRRRHERAQRKGREVKVYYTYQDDRRDSDNTLNALGVVYSVYF